MSAASPFVQQINRASKDAWPEVSAAYSQTHQTMLELAQIAEEVVPKVEEYVAKGASATLRRRKVCEETVWVLARLGWLRTGGERDVILAAKAYRDAADDPDSDDVVLDTTEGQLFDAISKLPEYMTTTPQEA